MEGLPRQHNGKESPADAGGTVQFLVSEDPTCQGGTKPMCHNHYARALEPRNLNYWACMPMSSRTHAPQQKKPLQLEAHSPQLESSPCLL